MSAENQTGESSPAAGQSTGATSSQVEGAVQQNKEVVKEVWDFKCASEASALLNCVANGGKKKSYNEIKCQNLLKALRECCVKEGVVDFTLTTGYGDNKGASSKN